MRAEIMLKKSGTMVRTYLAEGMLNQEGQQVKRLIKWDAKHKKLEEEIPSNLPVYNSFAEAKRELVKCIIRIVSYKYTLAQSIDSLSDEQKACIKAFVTKFQGQKGTLCIVSSANKEGIWKCALNSDNGHCQFIEPLLTDAEEQIVSAKEKQGVSRKQAIAEIANAAVEAYKTAFVKIAEQAIQQRLENNQSLPPVGDLGSLFDDK